MCMLPRNPRKTPPTPEELEEKLRLLSENQLRWQGTPVTAKLEILRTLEKRCSEVVTIDDWETLGEWTAHEMMGYPTTTAEGQFFKTTEAVLPLLVIKPVLERLVEAYSMACGVNTNNKIYDEKLKPRTVFRKENADQVVMDVFPLLAKDKFGPFGGLSVEWWLDPSKVSSEKETPQPFALESFSDKVEDGVLVILGAGNQSFLTLVDLLEGLFVRQRTVLIKHHPLRGPGLDPITRKLFEPLYEAGFLDSIPDLESVEANSALVYNPLVKAIHMTGGKPTHDAIVWGPQAEQKERKQQMKPKLANAEMTSELGCITPWVVVPAKYTQKQLSHHAQILMSGVHSNASSNCLAPKVVIFDENWAQKDEFIRCFREEWESAVLPVAYYPGCRERWTAYKENYPTATEWDSVTGQGIKERQLAPPMLNAAKGDKEATLLPLLCVDVEVDLTSKAGKEAAKQEYAFQHEPFCPVITFARVKNTNCLQEYMDSVVTLCNDYIYGSLSCSMSIPDALKDNESVQNAVAELKYGSIGINTFTGFCYQFGWGGHASQECLECVESGLGRINNYLFVPHLEKVVVRAPFVWSTHPKYKPDFVQAKKELDAVAVFVMKPGVLALLRLLGATIEIPKAATPIAVMAVSAVALAFAVALNR